jgi:hypothetical protein
MRVPIANKRFTEETTRIVKDRALGLLDFAKMTVKVGRTVQTNEQVFFFSFHTIDKKG